MLLGIVGQNHFLPNILNGLNSSNIDHTYLTITIYMKLENYTKTKITFDVAEFRFQYFLWEVILYQVHTQEIGSMQPHTSIKKKWFINFNFSTKLTYWIFQ